VSLHTVRLFPTGLLPDTRSVSESFKLGARSSRKESVITAQRPLAALLTASVMFDEVKLKGIGDFDLMTVPVSVITAAETAPSGFSSGVLVLKEHVTALPGGIVIGKLDGQLAAKPPVPASRAAAPALVLIRAAAAAGATGEVDAGAVTLLLLPLDMLLLLPPLVPPAAAALPGCPAASR